MERRPRSLPPAPLTCASALVLSLACAAPGAPAGGARADTGTAEEARAAEGRRLDVTKVGVGPRGASVVFTAAAMDGPDAAWSEPLLLRATERPTEVTHEGGGDIVVETNGDLLRITPRAALPGASHSLHFTFDDDALVAVGPADASDRADVLVFHVGPPSKGLSASIEFPRISRLLDVVPSAVDLGPDALDLPTPAVRFAQFCERTLLARFPADGTTAPRRVARHWIGTRVAPGPGDAGAAIAALPTVLATLFAEEERGRPDAATLAALAEAGAHAEELSDAWAVPRHLALRALVGADAYREALRAFYLAHDGGRPVTVADLADAFDAVGAADGARYARAWLAGPARPKVETHWRYDAERQRVLVRVDQVHELDGGVPAAYPFTLPIRVFNGSGALEDHVLAIDARRELLEVATGSEPLTVTFDPDGTLAGRVDL